MFMLEHTQYSRLTALMVRRKAHKIALLFFVLLAAAETAECRQKGPGLGQPAPRALIQAWNLDVFPDGTGLPPGQGDALTGKAIYQRHCQSCHGEEGSGGSAEELAGAAHGLTDEPPDKTIGTYWPYATTLFDFTRRSMPLDAPGSLDNDQIYAVTAYLLYLNGIINQLEVMNASTLAKVKMPNRDGFINVYQQH
ncbi:c-type cytochrome [Methylomarinum vadi]|uniref:c-type cytochrome n=1 Tax=Methylomarinum vadi TaxID=438855 RepID=UPI001F422D2E|nr:cytochrome c [Methylomarinum vadi]